MDLPAIILTIHADKAFLNRSIAVGARGYLLENGDMDELLTCIKEVHNGLVFICKGIRS